METKTFAVAAIREGTVIDHIKAGLGLKIVQLLKLLGHQKQVLVGLNLTSEKLGLKDLIKVEERALLPVEANQIALLSPHATVSIIKNYEVQEKYQVELPERIHKILTCQNRACITNHEKVDTEFIVSRKGQHIEITCRYCTKKQPGIKS